jgi:hypothetical protein
MWVPRVMLVTEGGKERVASVVAIRTGVINLKEVVLVNFHLNLIDMYFDTALQPKKVRKRNKGRDIYRQICFDTVRKERSSLLEMY